ncbi:MAG: hypothetical protein H0T40_13305 [Geodermatophilaceae bacterium]|nr:hypothetical protein [Geodermatophilaceae bacterium]
MTANPGVCDDPAVAGKSRDALAEEISTGHHPLFDHLRRDLARDLRTSVADLENLELSAGTAARVVSPGVELIALFVADDIPDGSFAPGATARAVTVAVAQEDGQWLVTGLNCVAVPGVATDMVTSHRKSRGLTWVMPALGSAAVARIVDTNSTLDRPAGDPQSVT